jgi:hypothetical protein
MSRIGTIVLPTATTSINGQSVTYADTTQLQLILNKIASQLDTLTAGQVSAVWNAANAPPTAVGSATTNPTSKILGITYGVGDYIRNKSPAVFVYNSANYITLGWVCTVAGNAGTATPPTFVAITVPVNL